jgi:hypothetical protein
MADLRVPLDEGGVEPLQVQGMQPVKGDLADPREGVQADHPLVALAGLGPYPPPAGVGAIGEVLPGADLLDGQDVVEVLFLLDNSAVSKEGSVPEEQPSPTVTTRATTPPQTKLSG